MTELEQQLATAYQQLAKQYEQQSQEILEQVAGLSEKVILLTNSKQSNSNSVKNNEPRLSNEQANSTCSDCKNALWTKNAKAEIYKFECLISTNVKLPVDFCSQKS